MTSLWLWWYEYFLNAHWIAAISKSTSVLYICTNTYAVFVFSLHHLLPRTGCKEPCIFALWASTILQHLLWPFTNFVNKNMVAIRAPNLGSYTCLVSFSYYTMPVHCYIIIWQSSCSHHFCFDFIGQIFPISTRN